MVGVNDATFTFPQRRDTSRLRYMQHGLLAKVNREWLACYAIGALLSQRGKYADHGRQVGDHLRFSPKQAVFEIGFHSVEKMQIAEGIEVHGREHVCNITGVSPTASMSID